VKEEGAAVVADVAEVAYIRNLSYQPTNNKRG
jgi:hypothetical protein